MNTWETEFLGKANTVKVRHDAENTIVTPYSVVFWSRPLKTLCAIPLVCTLMCGGWGAFRDLPSVAHGLIHYLHGPNRGR